MNDYRKSVTDNSLHAPKHMANTCESYEESKHPYDDALNSERNQIDSLENHHMILMSRSSVVGIIVLSMLVVVIGFLSFNIISTLSAKNDGNDSAVVTTRDINKAEVMADEAEAVADEAEKGDTHSSAKVEEPQVRYAALVGDSWQGAVTQENVSGSVDGQGLPIQAVRLELSSSVEGELQYCVADESGEWDEMVCSGVQAGESGVSALRVLLTGDLAESYDVWYCACVAGIGWMGWSSNGNPAGASGNNADLVGYRVAVLPKASGAPGPTDEAFKKLTPSISGDAELDAMLEEIVSAQTGTGEEALQNAFEYMTSYYYIKQNELPEGDWRVWSISYAKEMYRNKKGNCYRYASLFCWIARYLGYDARVISGRVPLSEGLMPHGWVEIRKDGMAFVCDADMHKFKPNLELFMVTYDESPYEFHRVDGSLYTNANAIEQ